MHPRRRLADDQGRELRQSVEIFAGADRRVGSARQPLHRLDIFRRRGVFQPHGIGVLDGIGQLDHVIDRIFPMALGGEIGVAQRGAHPLHPVDPAADVQIGELVGIGIVPRLGIGGIGGARHAVALHLEGGKAVRVVGLGLRHLLAPALGILGMVLGRLQGAIETHLVAKASAQQVAHRRLQQPPRQVPQRDLNAGCGMHGQPAGGAIAAVEEQQLGIKLDHIERVFADQLLLEAVEGDVLHPGTPIAFADAMHAGVGLDLDQVPVPGAADDHHLDVGDLDLLAQILRLRLERQGEAGYRSQIGQQLTAIHEQVLFYVVTIQLPGGWSVWK